MAGVNLAGASVNVAGTDVNVPSRLSVYNVP